MTDNLALTWYARGMVIPVILTDETPRPSIINGDNTGVSLADIMNGALGSINSGG